MEKIDCNEQARVDRIIEELSSVFTCELDDDAITRIIIMAESLSAQTILERLEEFCQAPKNCNCFGPTGTIGSLRSRLSSLAMEKITTEEELAAAIKADPEHPELFFEIALKLESRTYIAQYAEQVSLDTIEKLPIQETFKPLSKRDFAKVCASLIKRFEEEVAQTIKEKRQEVKWFDDNPAAKYGNKYAHFYLEIGNSRIAPRIRLLSAMVQRGVDVPEMDKKLKRLSEHLSYVHDMPNAGYAAARVQMERLESMFLELCLRSAKPDIIGEGLEFANIRGMSVAYLDGELVGNVTDARNLQAGRDFVVWEYHHVLDTCRQRGTQKKVSVYAWKKGYQKPKEVFESHAWTAEGNLQVNVNIDDDKIKVDSATGEEHERTAQVILL